MTCPLLYCLCLTVFGWINRRSGFWSVSDLLDISEFPLYAKHWIACHWDRMKKGWGRRLAQSLLQHPSQVSLSSQRWQLDAVAVGKCRDQSAMEFLGVLLVSQYCCFGPFMPEDKVSVFFFHLYWSIGMMGVAAAAILWQWGDDLAHWNDRAKDRERLSIMVSRLCTSTGPYLSRSLFVWGKSSSLVLQLLWLHFCSAGSQVKS